VRRLSPAGVVPVAVVALAVYAWVASPQDDGVLDRAAAALEEAGTVSIRTEVQTGQGEPFVTRFDVDLDRDVAVVHDPEPGVARRIVTPSATYEQLADGTWLELVEGAPPLFGQDVVAQLRGIEAVVEQAGPRRYRLRYRQLGTDATGHLVLDERDVPVRFTSTYEVAGREAVLAWEVFRTGFDLDVDPPASARPVTTEERAALAAAARSCRSQTRRGPSGVNPCATAAARPSPDS
jgi:hypothetical protein